VRGALAGLVAQCTPVTPAQFAEILAAAGVFSQADVLAEKARDDSALLVLALDYEDARTSRDALPPSPASGDVETLRQHFQAIMDTADADVRALVMLRDAHRAEAIT
jgi:hypothetical protein